MLCSYVPGGNQRDISWEKQVEMPTTKEVQLVYRLFLVNCYFWPIYSATSIFAVLRNPVGEIWSEKSGWPEKGGFIP